MLNFCEKILPGCSKDSNDNCGGDYFGFCPDGQICSLAWNNTNSVNTASYSCTNNVNQSENSSDLSASDDPTHAPAPATPNPQPTPQTPTPAKPNPPPAPSTNPYPYGRHALFAPAYASGGTAAAAAVD